MKTSGEAATGGLARLQGYRGRVGVLGRPARGPTARPTLGRIGPGEPDDARREGDLRGPCATSPWGARRPAAPVPPRSPSGSGSVALTRWDSVVASYPSREGPRPTAALLPCSTVTPTSRCTFTLIQPGRECKTKVGGKESDIQGKTPLPGEAGLGAVGSDGGLPRYAETL